MRTLLLCLIPFMAAALQAQTATPYDCQQSATFTASTLTTASYYNRGPAAPCVSWRLTYHTQSATGVSISLQGISFTTLATQSRTTFFTAGPDKIGIYINANTTGSGTQPNSLTLISIN